MAHPNTKYSMKYDNANTKSYKFKFNLVTDADIIAFLETLENKQGTIKRLIREEIERSQGN